MNADEILEALPDLSPEELARVYQASRALGAEEASQTPSTNLCHFYDSIKSRYTRRSMVVPATVERALTKKQISTIAREVDAVFTWCEEQFAWEDQTQQRAVLDMTIEIMGSWHVERGGSDTPRAMCLMLPQLPHALDTQFPGYAASGALGSVLKAMVNKS